MAPAQPSRSPRRRSSRVWASLLGGALAAGALVWAAPAQAQMKMAVVDVRRAVLETEEGLRVQSSLKKLFDSRQTELDARGAQLQKDREALEKEAQNPKTPKDALQKKVDAWQKAASEYQGLQYEAQKEMSRKEGELTTPILNKILGILKRLASQEGYDMIVDKSVVPYYRSDLELTDRAIQLYNAGSPDTGKPATPDNKTPAKPGQPAQPAPAQGAPKTTPTPAPAQPAPKSTAPAPAPAPAPKK